MKGWLQYLALSHTLRDAFEEVIGRGKCIICGHRIPLDEGGYINTDSGKQWACNRCFINMVCP